MEKGDKTEWERDRHHYRSAYGGRAKPSTRRFESQKERRYQVWWDDYAKSFGAVVWKGQMEQHAIVPAPAPDTIVFELWPEDRVTSVEHLANLLRQYVTLDRSTQESLSRDQHSG